MTEKSRQPTKNENNLFPHKHLVTLEMRSAIKQHQPGVMWLTGLSGSGKSTIANALEYLLVGRYRMHTYLLDGDNIRLGLNRDLGFTDSDRHENIRRVAEVARLMYDAGIFVITAFISPFRDDRAFARKLIPAGGFFEVFIDCPLEICQVRDPKALYQQANARKLENFTGVSSAYEPPLDPEIAINTAQLSVEACTNSIIDALIKRGMIN